MVGRWPCPTTTFVQDVNLLAAAKRLLGQFSFNLLFPVLGRLALNEALNLLCWRRTNAESRQSLHFLVGAKGLRLGQFAHRCGADSILDLIEQLRPDPGLVF